MMLTRSTLVSLLRPQTYHVHLKRHVVISSEHQVADNPWFCWALALRWIFCWAHNRSEPRAFKSISISMSFDNKRKRFSKHATTQVTKQGGMLDQSKKQVEKKYGTRKSCQSIAVSLCDGSGPPEKRCRFGSDNCQVLKSYPIFFDHSKPIVSHTNYHIKNLSFTSSQNSKPLLFTPTLNIRLAVGLGWWFGCSLQPYILIKENPQKN